MQEPEERLLLSQDNQPMVEAEEEVFVLEKCKGTAFYLTVSVNSYKNVCSKFQTYSGFMSVPIAVLWPK